MPSVQTAPMHQHLLAEGCCGAGGVRGAGCNHKQTGGRWDADEEATHRNALELLACQYALKRFKHEVEGGKSETFV